MNNYFLDPPLDPLIFSEEELLPHSQWLWDIPWEPTEIIPRLWMGGTPDNDTMLTANPENLGQAWSPSAHIGMFDAVVTVAASVGPAGTGVLEFRAGYIDDLNGNDMPDLYLLAQAVRMCLEWHAKGLRVLVRCRGGMNRSGLVTALALTAGHDMLFTEAVQLLKEKRHELVLYNTKLVEYGNKLAVNPEFLKLAKI